MKTERRSVGVLILGLAAATLLAGCSGSPPWGGWSKSPTPAQVQSALGPRSETYIYFARYEVYRQIHSKEYVYQDQGRWVHSSQPPAEAPEAVLQKSPSVEVTFSGRPEDEHQTVRRAHPPELIMGAAVVAALH